MIPFRINVPFSRTLHPLRYLGLSLSRRSYVNGKKYAFENEKIILETEKGRAAKDNDSLFEDIWRPNTFDANLPNSNHPLTAFKLRKSVSKRKSLLPLDTDIPILHVLQNPELRNYRFIPYSKNPYTSGEKIFEYSISETTRKLILNTILPLIKNDVVESINSIPSISSGLVVFSTPFIGSENYTKQLALFIASASEIQADFISIRLSDVFGRVPPFRALEGSFRTKETMEDSDENFDGNIFPLNLISERLNSLQKGRDAVIITETPKVNSSFSSSFSSSSSRKDKLHEFTDTTDVPFPWARRYYQGKNPLLIPRYHGASPSNISNLITSKFFKVFNAINLLKPSGNRKIIFFEDLMRLCSNQSQTLRDELVKSILLAISQVRQKYEEEGIGANFVVVTPNTEHKISEKTTSEKSQSIFQVIGNINEILSEGSIKDEENIHSTKLGPGTTLHGELDFGSPFSHALGVITIPVFPCASEVDIWEFQKKLDEDHKISVVESNLIELGIYSQFCNLLLPYDWKAIWLIGKYSPNPLFKSLSPLSFWQSPLDQLEVERLLEILFSKAKLKKKTSEETSGSLRSSDHLQNVHNEIPLPVPESESHFHVSIDDMNECANIILTTQLQKMELTNIFRVKSYFPYASPTARASQSLLNLIDKKQNLTKHEQRILKQCLVLPSSFSFKLIGGLERPKHVIHDLIQKPLEQPELFKKGILRQTATGLLLFGPPGTGKTLLARATASEANANFLSVQMSQIQSMWVGENEKNVQALFSLARKLKPCIIFIDEIDALLRTRSGGQRAQWSLNTLTEFMLEWDGIQSEANNGVIVMGSTNRPQDLDEAVLRRMPRRILVDLPDKQGRKEILSILLREDPFDFDLDWLVEKTDVYSGSDLKNLCSAAALERLRSKSDVITMGHLKEALRFVVPSTLKNSQMMKELRDWDKVYGTRGLLMAGKGFGFF